MINDILLRYAGPIKKFTLCTSFSDPGLQQYDLDRWFLFLSRNGIQELYISLAPYDHKYKLPYCIVSCRTIKQLALGYFIFDCPINAACFMFSGLTSLVFQFVQFSDTVNGIVCSIPNLEKLGFYHCEGISNFEIRAPKLESLSIISCVYLDKVRWFGFHLKAIKTLCVGARVLLVMTLVSDKIRLLEDLIDQDLKMLNTLKIELFRGSTLEMSFVKMVLSKSPALEKVVIQESCDIDSSIAIKIPRELLRFPRASPKAQIVYMDYNFMYRVVGFPEF